MPIASPELLRRSSVELRADPTRVLAKLFLPGQETLANGLSRADAVINRVLAMTDEVVAQTLDATMAQYGERHAHLPAILEEHFALVAHRLRGKEPSPGRVSLIGAYFTQEYSIESAALFNPSMVAHPDQSGLRPGELRFILSARAVGEGHISSIEFRTGVLSADGELTVDDPGRHVVAGRPTTWSMSREFLADLLAEQADLARAGDVLELLPDEFGPAELDAAVASVERDRLTRGSADAVITKIRWIITCNYTVTFDPARALAERVLFPRGADEGRGMEDARFTRFVADDGPPTYYGTYTAFDGANIAPHLIRTDDFVDFEISQMAGPAAKNKGMAIFPRLVDGQFLALSRWDRESIAITSSTDGRRWGDPVTVQTPEQPWEVIQLGNCGPPIETAEGWLVLNHGVGPMRGYAIGAILLDLDDPTKLLGQLHDPLLTPNADEREGYVPNVVYSCGPLRHGDTLVVPYGCSDSAIRFAFVNVPQLLTLLLADPATEVTAS